MSDGHDTGKLRPCQGVIQADAIYFLAEIRVAFGLSNRQLAEWKRHPELEEFIIQLPGGDAVYGDDLIQWLRIHRRKKPKPPKKE